MFLGISQNSQENTCSRVSFLIKLQAWGMQLYLKRDSVTSDFLGEFCKISKNAFSYRTTPVAASACEYFTVNRAFCWEGKTSWEKRKENLNKITNFLWENNFGQFLGYGYVYVNRQTFVWLILSVWEKVHLKLE